MLLEEGREIVYAEGLRTGFSNLTFKRVFDRLEERTGERITNASVIRRVWENQADFQTDVLVAIAHDEGRPEAATGVEVIAEVMGGLDFSTALDRAQSLRQICRVGGNAYSAILAESGSFALWISVIALATTAADGAQERRIKDALAEGYDSVFQFWSSTFAALFPVFGLRVRAPFTLLQFVQAVTAYSEGCTLGQRVSGAVEWLNRPTGPDGDDEPWTLFAVGLEAFVDQFLEVDPDFEPSG
jgi:hypothetical protein